MTQMNINLNRRRVKEGTHSGLDVRNLNGPVGGFWLWVVEVCVPRVLLYWRLGSVDLNEGGKHAPCSSREL